MITTSTNITPDQVKFLAGNLRDADVAECTAGGVTPLVALEAGVGQSHVCFSLSYKGELFGIAGSYNCEELETSFIWFLGTDRSVDADVAPHWYTTAPEIIDELRAGLPVTCAVSLGTNVVHHKWLQALGYKPDTKSKPGYNILTKEHDNV